MENINSIEVKYTENAQRRLAELQQEYAQRLEHHLKRRKYQKGKSYIEITSVDLDRIAKHYQYVRDTGSKMSVLTLYIFFVIGIISTLTGLSWPYLNDMLNSHDGATSVNKIIYAVTLIGGLLMVLISVALFYYIKLQEREKKKECEKRTMK